MNNEQDKIDNIFKKQLEDPARHVAFNDGDWDAMEQMLDTNKKPRILWLPIISSIAAMMLLVIGWWFFRPATVVDNPVKQQVATKAFPDTTTEYARHTSIAKNDTTTERLQLALAAKHDTTTEGNKVIAYRYNGADNRQGLISYRKKTNFNNTQRKFIIDQFPPLVADNTTQQNTGSANLVPKNTKADQSLLANADASNTQPDTSGDKMPALGKGQTTQTAANSISSTTATENPTQVIKSSVKKVNNTLTNRPQFALGIIASTDLNGINSFGSQAKVGSNFGVQVSMNIKKFTITTGAIYSVKPYMTGFQNYNTAYVFAQNPVSVSADCRMIDVPLNVGYQVYKKQRNKISVGTGLSSYFMLYENYSYNYGAAGPAAGPATYQVKDSKNYLLSVANINVNYERQLNPKLSLSVQPYMKVPLSAVGYSQVNLQSAGVAVGFNYHFNTIPKPK